MRERWHLEVQRETSLEYQDESEASGEPITGARNPSFGDTSGTRPDGNVPITLAIA